MKLIRALLVLLLLLILAWAAINYVYGSSSLPSEINIFGKEFTIPQAPSWLDADRRQPAVNQPQFLTNQNSPEAGGGQFKLDADTTRELGEQISAGLSATLERTQEFASRSGEVLGEFIQVNESDREKAAHERALEYAQYLYCQAVIEDWEERQPAR